MVPHRYPAKTLPTRSDTDSPAPRSSSMRALDASAALATRARSIAAPRRARREETRDAPEDTPAAPDAAPNEVARSRHSTSVPREKERVRRSLGVRRPPAAPTKPGKKKAVAKNGTIRSCRCRTRAKNRHRINGDHRMKTQSEKAENRKRSCLLLTRTNAIMITICRANNGTPSSSGRGRVRDAPPFLRARARANGTPVRSGRARARRAPVSARPNRLARPKRPIRFESRNHR